MRSKVFTVFFCALIITCGHLQAADRNVAKALLVTVDDLLKAGQADKAESMVQRSLKEDPNFPEAHFKLGQCLHKLNKPREALESYKKAAALAKAENNTTLARTAEKAAQEVCPGIFEITAADQKLIDRLLPIAEGAFQAGHLDTAASAYNNILVIEPDHEKAKSALEEIRTLIKERGDPVSAKLSEAKLAEVWYLLNAGQKDKATAMANELSKQFPDTSAGKEAKSLLASNFKPSKDDTEKLKQEMVAMAKKAKATQQVSASPTPNTTSTPNTGPGVSSTPPSVVRATPTMTNEAAVDMGELETRLGAQVKSLPKTMLVSKFKETFAKANDDFSKADPQKSGTSSFLVKALEGFVEATLIGMRIQEENMLTAELEKDIETASFRQYGCMKIIKLNQ